MQKIDLDSMSIDDLATLRDQATEKLADKIAARQRELVAEMEKLAAFGKIAKASTPKKEALKPQDAKSQEVKSQDLKAAADAPKAQVIKAA
jgi:hypothetical protein